MQLGGSRKLTKIKEATIIHKIFDTNFSFSGEIAHYRKNLCSAFQEFSASFDKMCNLAGRLSTKFSFCEFLRFSWYFLIF